MSFLKNAWYAAGWEKELTDKPVARRILGDPLVFFRGESGVILALYDACPHRFAPLSLGKVKGDRIACGYHGLEFDGSGACVRNPHGKGVIPNALGVQSYPVHARYGMIWVWMGDPEAASPDLIPSFPIFDEADFSWIHGQLSVTANYELIIDNLLDLTHVEFLHPFLASEGGSQRTQFRAEQKGNQVSAYYDSKHEPITSLFRLLWEGDDEFGDIHAYMHWSAPSNLYLDTGMDALGAELGSGPLFPTTHMLTPETEDSTHYFWAAGRNRCHGDDQVSGMLQYGTQHAFENEDEPMIKAVRSRMKSNDLFAHKPALLPMDEAAVRARRVLKRLIEEESSEAAA